MTQTFHYEFTLWAEGITQIQTIYNDLAAKVDRWLGRGVISITTTAQPATPTEGDAYIIAATHTGAQWASFTPNYLAVYLDGAWLEYAPVARALIYVDDESTWYFWTGAAWELPSVAVSPEFSDSTFRVQDNTDPTKELAFEVSGIATGTTRTITLPNADVVLHKHNLSATTAPTVSNDNTQGYGVGSTWWDTTNDLIYLCIDASTGAAIWQEVGAGGGGLVPVFKSGNYTANPGELVFCDSSGGVLTITLPITPDDAVRVGVVDAGGAAGTNAITVARNGQTINGVAENFVIDQNWGQGNFAYDGVTDNEWKNNPVGYPSFVDINEYLTGYGGQNLQTGTTYTLALSDAGKVVEMNNGSANTLTIPANASVAFPVNTRIDVIQYGAGATTINITSDTLRGVATIGGQYKMVSLWKRAATEWVVVGGS